MKYAVTALMLAVVVSTGFAGQYAPPTAGQDVSPGMNRIQYDDGTRHHKSCYNVTEVGWGIKCLVAPGRWVKIDTLAVNLCPPEIDGPYTGKMMVYDDNGAGGAPGDLLWSGTYDIRIGEWWHYATPTDLWVDGDFYMFNVIDQSCQYPQYCYQWFDGTDNAAPGTQWYKNGSGNFVADNTAGDIEQYAVVEAHDVMALSVETPESPLYWGSSFTPTAYVKNNTNWAQSGVPVRFWIPGEYDETVNVDFPANSTSPILVTFPTETWTGSLGNYTMHCATGMTHDFDPSNDEVTSPLTVHLKDAEAVSILVPTGSILVGYSVTPQCEVKNNGSETETFTVSFDIYNAANVLQYTNVQTVTLGPGGSTSPTFYAWTPSIAGDYRSVATTHLVGDAVPDNNTQTEPFTVLTAYYDAGAVQVISPTGIIRRNDAIPLVVRFHNYGTLTASFSARCRLTRPNGQDFLYSRNVSDLAPGADVDVQFVHRAYNSVGTWTIKAWSELTGDVDPTNDTCRSTFEVQEAFGWGVFAVVPGTNQVAKGAGLTSNSGETFWLVKGKNDPVIYTLSDNLDETRAAGTAPVLEKKLGKGTQIAYLDNALYLLKANKTLEFYSMDLATGTWTRLTDLPAGLSGKPARGGAALTVLDGTIYALKGNRTNEVYRFNSTSNTWEALAGLPAGAGRAAGDGAAMTSYNGRLFGLKGNRTGEFFTYDVASGGWQQLANLPTNRAKLGACLSCVNGTIYATTGGNKMGFFAYDMLLNTWTQLEDVPRAPDSRKVCEGASMTVLDGMVVLLKGKKTQYVLAYGCDLLNGDVSRKAVEGVQGGLTSLKLSLTMTPNPASGIVHVRYTAPSNGAVRIQLYNSTGALVQTVNTSRGSTELNAAGLANGTYVVKLTAGGTTMTRRLVIEH